ncbi:hypothetical protein SMACR_08622 [Sordaria macrospora]|uniref:mRNA-capping enzyme subunit beta n=2 Tax=Sordaria macrospora TaxID=5147 RepID=F7WAE3_SORMK|nr:uncharacterized protein SMAC_08622 [Sordaria macrospora k-hell]KAA8628214.1 hypothetical protein SMACR_08622 [Sordaria macrospora]CCC14178.1 unnamed protein product [Sordaria macrospora k-hell]
MDLRNVLNDSNSGPPPTTPGQAPHPGQQHQQSYIDYNHHQTRPSPGRQDSGYGTQRISSGPFAASPPPFSGPPAAGPSPYANRPPPPPPLQQVPAHDPRSPSLASGPGPSPYRHTPTSSISAQSGGYPFPPSAQHTPTSPVQRPYNQYPPTSTAAYPSREGYPPTPGGSVGVTGPPPPPPPLGHGGAGGAPYLQQGRPVGVPQTPPISTAGGGPGGGHNNPYIQRSHSTHSGSTPTPTSAHSQGPPGPGPGHSHSHSHSQVYGSPFGRGSPVAGPHSLPQTGGPGGQISVDPQQRGQSSQPATPVAGPRPLTAASTAGPGTGTRPLPQATPVGSQAQQTQQTQQAQSQSQNLNHYGQPPSPYQQRLPHSAATTHHHLNLNSPRSSHLNQQISSPHSHPQQQQQQQQQQPPAPAPPPPPPAQSLPRQHSAQSIYDARERERELRERSISISPKTRVPSLPSSAGRPATATSVVSIPESEPPRPNNTNHTAAPMARYRDEARPGDLGSNNAAAKRKLDDRELRQDELERRDVRPPPFENRARSSHTPNKSVKRRAYDSPPPWAQQATRGTTLKEPNFVLYKPVHAPGHAPVQINGHSRHPSPEEKRSVPRAHEPVPRAHEIRPNERSATPGAQGPPPEAQAKWGPLGPWESSITGDLPQDSMAKVMADFFFHYIVQNENMGEIQSRGIQFEIEAKFGEIIDRNTNQRIDLGVLSATILKEDDYVYPFRSIMTDKQHKAYNDFLNQQVVITNNPNSSTGRERPRVPVKYEHKKEVDRFYAIPPQIRDRELPVTIANLLASKGRDAKVRVSYKENKDGSREEIAKIVKARLRDLSIHFPEHRLDCRISINFEMPWEGSLEELEEYATSANKGQSPDRRKDRLSYRHCSYQFDLTQVSENVNGREEKKHELEIEVDPRAILDQGRRAKDHQPNQYFDLVEGFLNNIRIMAKLCA